MPDIVYGANCNWWDTIDNAATRDTGLPCCPNCGGVLFQMTQDEWNTSVHTFTLKVPEYEKYIQWQKGKCFPNQKVAFAQYKLETGIDLTGKF